MTSNTAEQNAEIMEDNLADVGLERKPDETTKLTLAADADIEVNATGPNVNTMEEGEVAVSDKLIMKTGEKTTESDVTQVHVEISGNDKTVKTDEKAADIDEKTVKAKNIETYLTETGEMSREIYQKNKETEVMESDLKGKKFDAKSTDADTPPRKDSISVEKDSSVAYPKRETTKESVCGIYSAIPEWTECYITNTIRLPRKREEVETAGKSLPIEREEFKKRMNAIKKRKQELIEKSKIIDRRISEFESFLQQSRAKLTEEAEKAEKERLKKQEEIAKQKEQIDVFKKVLIDLEKQIRHCQVFQDFVQKVADTSDEFTDASNIVDQYEILVSLKEELVEKETLFQEEMEKERVYMLQYYEEKHNEILRQKNELAALQISVTQAQNERLIWESKWNHTKEIMSGKSLERAEINTSIRNLSSMISEYQEFLLHNEDVKEEPEKITVTLSSEKSSGSVLHEEVIEQLQRIKEFILDWTVVVDEVKKFDHFSSTKVHHLS